METDFIPSDSLPRSSGMARHWKTIVPLVVLLAGAAVVLTAVRFRTKPAPPARLEQTPNAPAAELVSAEGMVLAGKPGGTEWTQVAVGAKLMEGDLVRTERSAEACIRYSKGNTVFVQENTVFAVQSASDAGMEISVSAPEAPPLSPEPPAAGEFGAGERAAVAAFNAAREKEPGPYIRLDRIVPFGRSLELVGGVEAGSRLRVNEEIVDVSGDGSFKHFTNPFPATDSRVRLVLRVSDLAGRIRTVAAVYDFNPRGRER